MNIDNIATVIGDKVSFAINTFAQRADGFDGETAAAAIAMDLLTIGLALGITYPVTARAMFAALHPPAVTTDELLSLALEFFDDVEAVAREQGQS